MLRSTPRVLDYLKMRGFKKVGVLKFQVRVGDTPTSERVGPLNLAMATRLELALVLTTDVRDPVQVICDASTVASRLPGSDHRSAAGRRALFKANYLLAWGDEEEVKADGFLTGVVHVEPDLRAMTVGIFCVGPDSTEPELVMKFHATVDPHALAELGESFATRGAWTVNRTRPAAKKNEPAPPVEKFPVSDPPIVEAVKIRTGMQTHPLNDPNAPIGLEVFYDGKPVAIEILDGAARIPEPREAQKVELFLRKRDNSSTRYGVVLQVNGLNTLYKQRRSPLECTPWVIDPEHPLGRISGYQINRTVNEPFRILSTHRSLKEALNYGPDAGTINLVVFREKSSPPARDATPKPGATPPSDIADEFAIMLRAPGLAAQTRPKNIEALRYQLLHSDLAAARGLIVAGTQQKSSISEVGFKPELEPVMSTRITYYSLK